MNLSSDYINRLVVKETMKAVRESLESYMGDDASDQEKRRQQKQAKAIDSRGLTKGAQTEVEEADDEEAEDATGVPGAVDSDEDAPTREDRTGGKGTKDSPKLKTPSAKKIHKATVGSVIDKLNALRGGRSLRDEEVQKSFKQYFDSLTRQERQTLLVFLTGIAQILAGTESGTEAIDPGDAGLRVGGKGPISKKKSVAKKAAEDPKLGEPQTTPIVVGEASAFKKNRALSAYKKYQDVK